MTNNKYLIVIQSKHSNLIFKYMIPDYRCPICIENLANDKVAAMCGHLYCGKYSYIVNNKGDRQMSCVILVEQGREVNRLPILPTQDFVH